MKKITVIYYSPTGTTKKVIDGILEGIGAVETSFADLRSSHKLEFTKSETDLVIIGMPTYISRIPPEAAIELKKIKADGIPVVIVAVYGNNKFGDILLEMSDIAKLAGLIPVAAGAFIGEHSFSSDDMPIATGRPDAADIRKAEQFGAMIKVQILDVGKNANFADFNPHIPGEFPYREWKKLPAEPPETDELICIKCGACKAVCPVDAICISDTISTDPNACIFCCACVKNCPVSARTVADPTLLDIRKRLYENCEIRREPDLYF